LNIPVSRKTVVSLTDQSGKMMVTKTADSNIVIDAGKLPIGVYYLKNNTTGETEEVSVNK
jgi:hypothetical protein